MTHTGQLLVVLIRQADAATPSDTAVAVTGFSSRKRLDLPAGS